MADPKQQKTAVVIPVYNRDWIINDALESVLAQTRCPDHLIVIDDGSCDDTVKTIEQWRDQHHPSFAMTIDVLAQNQGQNGARNRGVELACDCDLIAYLDSDDVWPATYLEEMIGQLEENPELIATARNYWQDSGDGLGRVDYDLSAISTDAPLQIFKRHTAAPSSTVVRRSAHQAIGGWDQQVFCVTDLDYFLRMSCTGPFGWNSGEPIEIRWMTGHGDNDPSLVHESSRVRRPAGAILRMEILEKFIFDLGGRNLIPEPIWKERLATGWFRVGRKLVRKKRKEEAKWCYLRVSELRPFDIRCRWHRWIRCFRVAPRRPAKTD